jgi:hypothetical protein
MLPHMRESTDFSSQHHAPSSLAVGATLTQEDFFVLELTKVWQLGIEMVLHTRSLFIEVIVPAFPMTELRRVVPRLLNAVVVASSPWWQVGACPSDHSPTTGSSEHSGERGPPALN